MSVSPNNDTQHNDTQHNAEFHCAECWDLFFGMLSVVWLSGCRGDSSTTNSSTGKLVDSVNWSTGPTGVNWSTPSRRLSTRQQG
jgi:hypothetical protein